jgi:hypothetical protein
VRAHWQSTQREAHKTGAAASAVGVTDGMLLRQQRGLRPGNPRARPAARPKKRAWRDAQKPSAAESGDPREHGEVVLKEFLARRESVRPILTEDFEAHGTKE